MSSTAYRSSRESTTVLPRAHAAISDVADGNAPCRSKTGRSLDTTAAGSPYRRWDSAWTPHWCRSVEFAFMGDDASTADLGDFHNSDMRRPSLVR